MKKILRAALVLAGALPLFAEAKWFVMMRGIILFSTLFAALTVCARGYEVPRLPDSGTLVSEVTTNVPFNVSRNDVRTFAARLEVDAPASNAVQVAFGRDANGDGNLTAEETDLILGLRHGWTFIENVHADARMEIPIAAAEGTRRFFEMTVKTDSSFVPKSCVFTNEMGACFEDVSAACPFWTFKPEWDLFKVTRRGTVGTHEFVRVSSSYNYTIIILR